MGAHPWSVSSPTDGCVSKNRTMQDNVKNILGVLMDYHMPVMSGKETTKIIRDSEVHEGLSKQDIFYFTADATDSTRQELLMSGMDDVLSKPVSMRTLEATCVKIICRKESLAWCFAFTWRPPSRTL